MISHSSLERSRRRHAPSTRSGHRLGGDRKETSIIAAPAVRYGRPGRKIEAALAACLGQRPRPQPWPARRNAKGDASVAEDYQMPKGELMRGKRGVVTGVANHQSIAWGIASQLAAQGAELAFGYMEMNEKRVKPLGESLGVKTYATFDALQEGSIPAAFEKVKADFGTLDFLVHAIGFAD